MESQSYANETNNQQQDETYDRIFCVAFVSPRTSASSLWYDLCIGLPTLAFVVYLMYKCRLSVAKLQRTQSHIMLTYYVFLWIVCGLNLFRVFMQIVLINSNTGSGWDALWIIIRFGLIMLEISVVVFLLQGYQTSGKKALYRTLVISGAIAGIEGIIKIILVYGGHVSLFLYQSTEESSCGDLCWSKWSFWMIHSLLFAVAYLAILILPMTRWSDVLPAKPSFYRYVLVLFVINGASALASLMLGAQVLFGYCIYALSNIAYYTLYPPLLYWTFLSEFFQDDEMGLDMMMYAEMKEAGCFEETDEFY